MDSSGNRSCGAKLYAMLEQLGLSVRAARGASHGTARFWRSETKGGEGELKVDFGYDVSFCLSLMSLSSFKVKNGACKIVCILLFNMLSDM